MSTIKDNLSTLKNRIETAANACHRSPSSIKLLAVSKKHSLSDIQTAYQLGLRDFGENQVQEALPKIQAFSPSDIQWHFIGPIQSNKTAKIAQHFHWVHSLCRADIIQRLNNQRPDDLSPINVCIQLNLTSEATKSGASLAELVELTHLTLSCPKLRLRGLMCIPKTSQHFDEQRQAFHQLAEALKTIKPLSKAIDTLSMGMSGDLEAAITEGATIVRVGSAIFGQRTTL